MNLVHAIVVEGMHPAEREHFDETIAVEPRLPAPAAAVDEQLWGTDADAQARQQAAMTLFGGAG